MFARVIPGSANGKKYRINGRTRARPVFFLAPRPPRIYNTTKDITMKIIKKPGNEFIREDAHGGSGGRKLYFAENEIENVQGMTYGYLPGGVNLHGIHTTI